MFGQPKGISAPGSSKSMFTRQPADVVKPAWAKAITAKDLAKLQKKLTVSNINAVWTAIGKISYQDATKCSGVAPLPFVDKAFKGFFSSETLPWTPLLFAVGSGFVEAIKFIQDMVPPETLLEKQLSRFDKTMSVREHVELEFPHMVKYLAPRPPPPVAPVASFVPQPMMQPQPVLQPQPLMQPQPQPPPPFSAGGTVFGQSRETYTPKTEKELMIYQHDTVEILVRDNSGWWQCRRRDGAVGWLPSTLLILVPPPQNQNPVPPQGSPPPLRPPPAAQPPQPNEQSKPPPARAPPIRTPPLLQPPQPAAVDAVVDSNIEERIRAGVEAMLRKHKDDLFDILKGSAGAAPTNDQMELRLRMLEAQSGRASDTWELEQRMADQLKAVRSQAQEDRHRVVMELKRLASDGDTTSATVLGLRSQLQQLESVQQELVALAKSAKQREEMRAQYGSEPRVWDFYNSLCVRFEEWLLGIKSAASGVVSHDVQGLGGKVGGFMCLCGEICEMIPFVGEGAGAIKLLGGVVRAVDHKRQQNVIQRVSKFGTLAEMQNLSASLAYRLTRRYEYQLLQLLSLPDMAAAQREKPKWSIRKLLQRGKEKVEQVVLDQDPKSASEALADFVLALFVLYLRSSSRDALEPAMLERALFECASQPGQYAFDDKAAESLEAFIQKAGSFELDTKTGLKWTFAGVLTGPGVRTPSGVYFDGGASMQPHVYQYCAGDDAEVMSRSLVACSVVPVGPAPKPVQNAAQSRFVNAVVAGQQSNDASVELLKRQLQQQQAALQAVQEQQQQLLTGSSGSVVLDDVKRLADEMFDLFDTSQNGLMDVGEFCGAFDELVVLDEEHFGALVPEAILRDAFAALGGGAAEITREVFVSFYRKAYAFKLAKACQLLLKRGNSAPGGGATPSPPPRSPPPRAPPLAGRKL